MDSSSESHRLVLSQKAKDNLPPLLRFVMKQFQVRKVWTVEGCPPLPTPDMSNIHYRPDDQPEYVAYCRAMLDQGYVTQGIAKSMLVGLAGCGRAGKELAEIIKAKKLKR